MSSNICNDAQVQLSTTYSRGKPKRTFNMIINGVVMTTVLFSTLTMSACGQAASTKKSPLATQKVSSEYNKNSAEVQNLVMATKAINDMISKSNWTIGMFDSLINSLNSIDSKLASGDLKPSDLALKSAITSTDKSLSSIDFSSVPKDNLKEIENKHSDATKLVSKIGKTLGITTTSKLPNTEVVASNSSPGSSLPSATSKSDPPVSVPVQTSNTTTSTTSTTPPAKYAGYHLVSTKLATNTSHEMIWVKYGNHTYGCKNQEEYNEVLSRVESEVANIAKYDTKEGTWAYNETLKGVKYTAYPEGSDEWGFLRSFQSTCGYIIYKTKPETSKKFVDGTDLGAELCKGTHDPGTGVPSSAYDVLHGQSDCDSSAQLMIAIFDAMGINTRIWMMPGHAAEHVQLDGIWFATDGTPVNPNLSADSILVGPTW